MAAIRPRDLLSEGLLERLGGTALAARTTAGGDTAAILSRDIGKLGAVGYLKVALPPEFGGLGCTLRQAACGQRRLARHAPLTALAVSAHLYWTGAAADAYRAGDDSARWILLEAARGALFAAGHGAAGGGDLQFADPQSRCEPAGESGYRFRDPAVLSSVTPAWDWVAVHAVHAAHSAPPAAARPDAPAGLRGTTPAPPISRLAARLAVHVVVQHQERDAEHRERVFRAQFPGAVHVHVQPLGEPVHRQHCQVRRRGIDVGQVVP
jgi:hypothetical protein